MSTISATTGSDRIPLRGWIVLLILSGAIFLEGIDVAMLNIALPSIRAELGLTTTELSALASAYVLGYAGFVLLGGRLADLIGRRRMFLTALAAFTLFSVIGGIASEGWMLLVVRFITGLSAAFMTPAGLSLITTTFEEGPQRNQAVLIYAGIASAGFSLGLVAGGFLTSFNWRWVFFAPAIAAAVLMFLSIPFVVDKPVTRQREPFDAFGALTLTGAMLTVTYGLTQLEHLGGDISGALYAFAISAVLWLVFFAIESRSRAPLVRLGILGTGNVVRANVASLLFAGAFLAFQFLVSLYLQELMGRSVVQTSFALVLIAIDAILAPVLTPKLVARFGNLPVVTVGLVFAVAAYALFLRLNFDWTYSAMVPSMLLLGIAFSLAYGPLTILATDGVAEDEQGLASGLFTTAFQFGGALGLAGASVVSAVMLGAETSSEGRLEALRLALTVPVGATVLAALVLLTGLRKRRT